MALQRITLELTELRCLQQGEGSSGSEPYLWITYLAIGAEPLPFQTGLVGTKTPSFGGYRAEFPNGMKAGQATPIPSPMASASFDFDLDSAPQPKMIGCIAVLMEEDSSPERSIVLGQITYSKEIDKQLDELMKKRLREMNFDPVTPAEIATIKKNVDGAVRDAIASTQSIWNFFTDQDDNLGFVYKIFTHAAKAPAESGIRPQSFELPEIRKFLELPEIRTEFKPPLPKEGVVTDRFLLSGRLHVGPVPSQPVILCAAQRAALKAKQDEIAARRSFAQVLRGSLQTATPQQKSAIVAAITDANKKIAEAEAQLPALQAALNACMAVTENAINNPEKGVVLGNN